MAWRTARIAAQSAGASAGGGFRSDDSTCVPVGNQARASAVEEPSRSTESSPMSILKWALIFLVISIIAGLLGFTGVSIVSADIARALFYVFLVIFLVLLILGLTIFRA
jgi:uncharacterized membrane protein YtjA (UPF0391 family)